ISIEPEFNNVVIYLNMHDGKNKKFIENVETLNPSPIIKPLSNKEKEEILFNSSTLVEKRNIYILVDGGNKIVSVNDHANGTLACSAGFWIKKNNEDFILTAGHCFEIVQHYLMDIKNKYKTRIKANHMTIRWVILRLVQFQVVGSSEITNCRVHMCKTGQRTGISCSFVTAFNSIRDFDTIVVIPMENNAGGSGGSMFRYNGLNGQSHLADA
ncbi:17211_t:CDS:2, partial [Gigaspora rosea]